MKGNTFKLDPTALVRVTQKMNKRFAQDDRVVKMRVEKAVEMIWRIAHQKRPMINAQQAKMEGRSKRVSDPSAQAGVPVQTGTLQASITRKVTRNKLLGYTGEVGTKGIKYAGYMEYGTTKIKPRPFMRPAINLTKEAIKRMFGFRIEANL